MHPWYDPLLPLDEMDGVLLSCFEFFCLLLSSFSPPGKEWVISVIVTVKVGTCRKKEPWRFPAGELHLASYRMTVSQWTAFFMHMHWPIQCILVSGTRMGCVWPFPCLPQGKALLFPVLLWHCPGALGCLLRIVLLPSFQSTLKHPFLWKNVLQIEKLNLCRLETFCQESDSIQSVLCICRFCIHRYNRSWGEDFWGKIASVMNMYRLFWSLFPKRYSIITVFILLQC